MLVAGAGPGSAAGVSLKGVTLRVGTQTDGIHALLNSSGALKGVPYKIAWSTFTSGPLIVEALQSGKVDAGAVGNTPPIFGAASARTSFKIVAGIQTRSHMQNYLVVPTSSSIRSLKDLKGKRVAYTEGAISESFLIEALGRAGLKLSDIQPVNVQPADALAAFKGGKIDAWSTHPPFLQLIGAGARRLSIGTGYAADGLNIVLAYDGALNSPARKAAIRDYLGRLRKALAWGNVHPQEWAKAVSSENSLPLPVALQAVATSDVIPAGSKAVVAPLQKLADILHKAGVIKQVDITAVTSNQLP